MSSISSVGSASCASQIGSSSGSKRNTHMDGLDQDLTSFLTSQNVSADDQNQILSEVKEAMATAPGTRKADASSLQDIAKKVLDNHNLSGDDFVSQMSKSASSTDATGSDGSATADSASGDKATSDASSTSDDSDISSIIQKLLAMFGQSSSSNDGSGAAQSGLTGTNDSLFDMIDVQA